MAKNTSTVYLGYEDEAITEKNKSLVDFMTNKVGGQPVSALNNPFNQSLPSRLL